MSENNTHFLFLDPIATLNGFPVSFLLKATFLSLNLHIPRHSEPVCLVNKRVIEAFTPTTIGLFHLDSVYPLSSHVSSHVSPQK